MNARDLGWRLAAIAISLVLHLWLAAEWADNPLIAADSLEEAPTPLFVQLNFPQPNPASVTPVVEPPAPVAEQKPPEEPKPKPKPNPKPAAKSKPEPKPFQRPVEKLAERSEEPTTQLPAPPPPPAASHRKRDLRNEYMARLMAEIEKNKFYPRIARRRNLQGTVRVKFRLGCGGEVEKLDISGEHSLLRKAAGKAVEDSLPLPKIPTEIECPLLVNYAMAYSLER